MDTSAEPLDRALAALLDSGSEDDLSRLKAFGPRALDRLMELCYRGSDTGRKPLRTWPQVAGRELVDAWSSALASLGQAFPDRFLDAMEEGSTATWSVREVCVVAAIPGSRAIAWLAPFAELPDDVIRYHAVSGLGSRDDEIAVSIVDCHLTDPSPLVRLAAIRGLVWRDSGRAAKLLAAMAADASIPPAMRSEAQAALLSLS